MLHTFISILNAIKVAKDGRHYLVIDGRAKYMPAGTITPSTPVESAPSAKASNYRKESVMYHFIKSHKVFGEIRVITNAPTEDEALRYSKSRLTNMVVDELFGVDTGTWEYQMLIKRLVEKNVPFRLGIVQNGAINPGPHADQEEWKNFRTSWKNFIGRVNFAWANASTTFLLQFPGETQWGLAPMGLELMDAPKSSKRANEIVRCTEMFYYTEDINSIKIGVRDPKDLKPTNRDGMGYISKSFALRMVEGIRSERRRKILTGKIKSGKISRENFRLVFPKGVIKIAPKGGMMKGDVIIRPDRYMKGYDIITPPENIKLELRATEPFMMATGFEHHPVHEATWDIQRMLMNPQILTHEHRSRDLDRLVTDAKASVEAGILPDWIIKQGTEAHDDDDSHGLPIREIYASDSRIEERWQVAGLDVRASQNIVTMAMRTVGNRMGKFFTSVENGVAIGYAKTMWLPKSNAMVALIVSHGSLTKVGNYRGKYDGSKSYFIGRFGLVISDKRFEKIYALMGGADFDDSAEMNLVKIWSSDPSVTKMMRDNGVIGEDQEIPTSEDNAAYVAAILRSPNGPGEFSFLEMEDILDLPWQFLDLDTVEVIDLADLPLPQGEMMKQVTVAPIQSTVTYSGVAFTSKDAIRQILVQQHNPKIGQAANALMAWAGVAGPSMPPSLGVPFETLVDGVQQTADPAIFKEVKLTAKAASQDAINYLKQHNGTVDSYLIHRFAGAEHKGIAANHAVDGPYAEFQEKYRAAIKQLHDQVQQKGLQMRHTQPVIRLVRELNFGSSAYLWAQDFTSKYTAKLSKASGDHMKIKRAKGLRKIILQREKFHACKAVIDEAMAEIQAFEHPGQRALALWWYLVRPDGNNKYGVYDRVMFQEGNEGAIADILIPVLVERGWINLPEIEDDDDDDINELDEGDDDDDEFFAFISAMQDDN